MARFEDFAEEAGRSLAASSGSVEVPSVSELAVRRRRGVVAGMSVMAVLVVVVLGLLASLGGSSSPPVASGGADGSLPAVTVPLDDGGYLFGPPRVNREAAVEFPLILLDGRRVSVVLPDSVGGDVAGMVPGGATGWEVDVCCARTLDVIYGSVDDIYGDREPDETYEDADGNPVGFYSEENDLDYLVFEYGSWVVRAWDGGPGGGETFSEDERVRFASLMTGYETQEGFLVLDPSDPMTVMPTDAPDATLTDDSGAGLAGGAGLVGVITSRDCAAEGPFADPETVTTEGYLVSVSEESGTTSICNPANSLMAWISRTDLSEAELDTIRLTYEDEEPVVDESTTTTSTPTTTSTESRSEPTVNPIPIEEPVSLRVLAVRGNNPPSLAILDLSEGKTTIYEMGVHALSADPVDGAVATPNGDWIIWSNGIAYRFSDSLDTIDVQLGPDPPRQVSGYAPALRVVPLPDGTRAWLVQPGITFGSDDYPTLVDLITLDDASSLLSVEVDGSAFRFASTNTGLVLNTHRWLDTGDGFVTEPGSENTIHLTDDEATNQVGIGWAIAASPTRIARMSDGDLVISDPDGGNRVQVTKPIEGTWIDLGGPMVPSDAMPLQTVSPDGSQLAVSIGQDLDVNGKPAYSELIAVDLSNGSTRTLAQFDGRTPNATWSSDGEWIALLGPEDIILINTTDPSNTQSLEDVIPDDHYPLAAG